MFFSVADFTNLVFPGGFKEMFSNRHFVTRLVVVAAMFGFGLTAVNADTVIDGGEVNISGATLFRDFFFSPASTNDYIDANGDGFFGFDQSTPPFVDQLAPLYGYPSWNGWWLVQYRGVGSVNGLGEFIDFQLQGLIPDYLPNDDGIINHTLFAADGAPSGSYPACNGSNTPECPTSIDMAVLDVPTKWAVRAGAVEDAAWSRNPTESGYGHCQIPSDDGMVSNLQVLARNSDPNDPNSQMVYLNTDTGTPDANTVFDTQVAWVPIAIIANRGTGLENVKETELQYHFVTGRFPNGLNLVAATRDVGSGTRNGAMNSLDIDPSWGRGDNLGSIDSISTNELLGPTHQPTNKGGSSRMEGVIQNNRLSMGYTGVAGGSRAVRDTIDGKYEIVNVMFDDRGGSTYVRPTIDAILDNSDPSTGWQIGGPETFATRGNPDDTDENSPAYMANQSAADYLRNILASIAGFIGNPPGDENFNMPGEVLALNYFLLDGVDALPNPVDPSSFVTNTMLNQTLQDFIRANNDLGVGQDTPPYGSANVANRVPKRVSEPCWPDPVDPNDCLQAPYSDGSNNGNYYNYFTDDTSDPTGGSFIGATELNARNALMGDFDGDRARNLSDVAAMMAAVHDPSTYATNSMYSTTSSDPVVPEIIGDFTGDGNFDAYDVRYFADGLAIDTLSGKLDRKQGFTAVDTAWATLTGDDNYFGTTLATSCKSYVAGDSRGDIAGNTPTPGSIPMGADGIVDGTDLYYVYANFGDFSNIDDAVLMDLSADLNGDLLVNEADVTELMNVILGTAIGDLDWDCDVDLSDLAALLGSYGSTGELTYEEGDLDGDGDVDLSDLAALLGHYGF